MVSAQGKPWTRRGLTAALKDGQKAIIVLKIEEKIRTVLLHTMYHVLTVAQTQGEFCFRLLIQYGLDKYERKS
jgi:hypothetical protein